MESSKDSPPQAANFCCGRSMQHCRRVPTSHTSITWVHMSPYTCVWSLQPNVLKLHVPAGFHYVSHACAIPLPPLYAPLGAMSRPARSCILPFGRGGEGIFALPVNSPPSSHKYTIHKRKLQSAMASEAPWAQLQGECRGRHRLLGRKPLAGKATTQGPPPALSAAVRPCPL